MLPFKKSAVALIFWIESPLVFVWYKTNSTFFLSAVVSPSIVFESTLVTASLKLKYDAFFNFFFISSILSSFLVPGVAAFNLSSSKLPIKSWPGWISIFSALYPSSLSKLHLDVVRFKFELVSISSLILHNRSLIVFKIT